MHAQIGKCAYIYHTVLSRSLSSVTDFYLVHNSLSLYRKSLRMVAQTSTHITRAPIRAVFQVASGLSSSRETTIAGKLGAGRPCNMERMTSHLQNKFISKTAVQVISPSFFAVVMSVSNRTSSRSELRQVFHDIMSRL